jgi:hypothetical protein
MPVQLDTIQPGRSPFACSCPLRTTLDEQVDLIHSNFQNHWTDPDLKRQEVRLFLINQIYARAALFFCRAGIFSVSHEINCGPELG